MTIAAKSLTLAMRVGHIQKVHVDNAGTEHAQITLEADVPAMPMPLLPGQPKSKQAPPKNPNAVLGIGAHPHLNFLINIGDLDLAKALFPLKGRRCKVQITPID